MDLYLINMQFFTLQYINELTGVVRITVMFFISCLDSFYDGTHSLQMIHWWANDVMLNLSKSALMQQQNLGWSEGEFAVQYV